MNPFRRTPKNTIKPGSYLERRGKLVLMIEQYEADLKVYDDARRNGVIPYGLVIEGETYTQAVVDAFKQDLLILDTKHELGL